MKIKDKKELQKLQEISKKSKNKQERVRAHAIVLSNSGKKSHEIAEIFDVTQRSVFKWFKEFKEQGFDSLPQQKGRGRKRLLNTDEHLKIVQKNIENSPHQPKKAFALTIEEIGIDMSYNTFKRFLKKYSISATNE